jgi:hypothetical protein
MKRINPDKMSKAQLDRLGAAAEKITFESTRPLTTRDRAAFAQASRKAGRPRQGAGAERINVTVERDLLSLADAYARKHKMTRAALVAEGLRRVIAA